MTDLEYNGMEEVKPGAELDTRLDTGLEVGAKPRSRAAKVHTVVNIVLAVLATAAFFFVALFTYSAADAYIGMKNFNGEGFNGDGLGFAIAFVLVLVASLFSAPLSLACTISSGIAVKLREGRDRTTSLITLIVTAVYLLLNLAAVVAFAILGNS